MRKNGLDLSQADKQQQQQGNIGPATPLRSLGSLKLSNLFPKSNANHGYESDNRSMMNSSAQGYPPSARLTHMVKAQASQGLNKTFSRPTSSFSPSYNNQTPTRSEMSTKRYDQTESRNTVVIDDDDEDDNDSTVGQRVVHLDERQDKYESDNYDDFANSQAPKKRQKTLYHNETNDEIGNEYAYKSNMTTKYSSLVKMNESESDSYGDNKFIQRSNSNTIQSKRTLSDLVKSSSSYRRTSDSYHESDEHRRKSNSNTFSQHENEMGDDLTTTAFPLSMSSPTRASSTIAVSISDGPLPSEMTQKLSKKQQLVLDLVMQGKNVFFTGAAGTGKSHVMKLIVRMLQDKFTGTVSKVFVCAPTGIAACNIGGTTIHSFAGIGLGKEDAMTLAQKIKSNKWVNERWRNTKVLVIDEISMLDCALFDKLEEIARIVRGTSKVFGGIQIVAGGDFYQLPPVGLSNVEDEKRQSIPLMPKSQQQIRFCFESKNWKNVMAHTVVLEDVYRQKDSSLIQFLNELREGIVSPEFEALMKQKQYEYVTKIANQKTEQNQLKSLASSTTSRNEEAPIIHPTVLFPTNQNVDKLNATRLMELQMQLRISKDANTMSRTYKADDWVLQPFFESMLAQLLAPPTLTLCVGAQVVLLKNLTPELVNGSRGVVVGFQPKSANQPSDPDDPEFGITKGPGRKPGNGNEFLSKSTSNDLIALRDPEELLPLVLFSPRKSANGEEIPSFPITIERGEWEVKEGDKKVASRIQIPLKLAWALSIHKSQGMTIDNLEVDLSNVFEYGQAYVALSRATSLEGLVVRGFDKSKVRSHPLVESFYKSITKSSSNKNQSISSSSLSSSNKPY